MTIFKNVIYFILLQNIITAFGKSSNMAEQQNTFSITFLGMELILCCGVLKMKLLHNTPFGFTNIMTYFVM